MAITTVAAVLAGAVTVGLDVSTTGAVTSVVITNTSAQSVTVDVTRPSGSVLSKVVAAGATSTSSIAKGKQFTFDAGTSDWSVSVSVG